MRLRCAAAVGPPGRRPPQCSLVGLTPQILLAVAGLAASTAVSTGSPATSPFGSTPRPASLDSGTKILLRAPDSRFDGGVYRVDRDVALPLTPRGQGPTAPLTDVLVHGADMLQPLGRSVEIAPDALRTSLTWLAQGRAKGFVPKGRVDGLVFEATDIDLKCGNGSSVVRGATLAVWWLAAAVERRLRHAAVRVDGGRGPEPPDVKRCTVLGARGDVGLV